MKPIKKNKIMLVDDKKLREFNELIKNIELDKAERDKKGKRITYLREQLRQLSLRRMTIERSGNEKRIRTFNSIFFKYLTELSKLVQTTGTVSRDKIAQLVREIKNN